MLLNSENLKNIPLKTKKVSLKKADAEICVALLPASIVQESRDLKDDVDNPDRQKELGFKIISAGVVDEQGNTVFKTIEDFEALPMAIQREIQDAIFDYNGLTEESQKQLEKN